MLGVTTIDLLPDPGAALDDRLRELTDQLTRERARNAGLEQGLGALSERVETLRVENLELRRKLELRG